MAKTMSLQSGNEYLETMRGRYRRYTGKAAKTRLLDEYCEVTGHERKYANKLLQRHRGPGRRGGAGPKKPGVAKTCGAGVAGVLFDIWKVSEQPCGKRLKPMLAHWPPFYEKHHGGLPGDVRSGVLAIGAAQIEADPKVRPLGG